MRSNFKQFPELRSISFPHRSSHQNSACVKIRQFELNPKLKFKYYEIDIHNQHPSHSPINSNEIIKTHRSMERIESTYIASKRIGSQSTAYRTKWHAAAHTTNAKCKPTKPTRQKLSHHVLPTSSAIVRAHNNNNRRQRNNKTNNNQNKCFCIAMAAAAATAAQITYTQ